MNAAELKEIVARFNRDIIEHGDFAQLDALVAPDFINHTAAPGIPSDRDGLRVFLVDVLHAAFSDREVEIHDQIAEGDRVATRKTIHGSHTGRFLDIAPTGRRIALRVTDIVRLRDGRYVEHWGSADFHGVMTRLKEAAAAS